jgi:hypothetical protein
MGIKLAGHLFTGPFSIDETEVRANQPPVVFAIIAKGGQPWSPTFRAIDIGASPDEGIRFADHPRRENWHAAPGESIGIYLFYARRSEFSSADRERMATQLSEHYRARNGRIE